MHVLVGSCVLFTANPVSIICNDPGSMAVSNDKEQTKSFITSPPLSRTSAARPILTFLQMLAGHQGPYKHAKLTRQGFSGVTDRSFRRVPTRCRKSAEDANLQRTQICRGRKSAEDANLQRTQVCRGRKSAEDAIE